MQSKLNRQQKAMTSLAKPKYKTSEPEKQNTWSNLLNKNSTNSNTTTVNIKTKHKKNLPIIEPCIKTISKSVQCDSPVTEQCQISNTLSVLNPIRTLQFLLKEIIELPNIQNTGITQIIDEMRVVVEKIISENASYSKSYVPVINDDSMIPTRDNDYCKDLKYGNNLKENKYFVVLFEKISELENNYSQLTKNYTLSEEKLLCVTSERDKLLEKFKEACGSMEKFNNREREYLDTITELKSKLIASEKLITKQETIITTFNKRLNHISNKNQVKELADENVLSEQNNLYKAVVTEKNNYAKLNMDKSKMFSNLQGSEVPKLGSDKRQKKQFVLSGLANTINKSMSMASSIPETNLMKNFSTFNDYNEKDIGIQYIEHHRQASAIKQAKTELQQLFETVATQANLSKQLFHSTVGDNAIYLNDISDEEDDRSNVTNSVNVSVITDSSC